MVNKFRLYWTLQITGWLIYVLLQIVFSIIASTQGVSSRRIIFYLLEALICIAITHLYRYVMNRRQWLQLPMTKLFPRAIGTIMLMSAVVYLLRIPASIASGRLFNPEDAFNIENFLGLSFFYMILFFLWSVFYFTFHYVEQYNKSLKYEASRIEIELNNLKSQLNPHFIFNALNSIRALVDENPKKSKQAINHLSNILRNSLVSDRRGLTKFDDELKIVKDYLSLESIRFEERLRIEYDIHPDSNTFLVPPLMVQTLVENGIKHGVSKLTEGGLIAVKTIVEGGNLRIQIRNSGHYHQYHVNGIKRKGGLGLKNTAQRLKLLYGENASFKIENESDTFVLTEVIIPQSHESTDRR
jgi:two-component system, LytTR family, sensor kinase